jgi:hypothetical protein
MLKNRNTAELQLAAGLKIRRKVNQVSFFPTGDNGGYS